MEKQEWSDADDVVARMRNFIRRIDHEDDADRGEANKEIGWIAPSRRFRVELWRS